MSEEKKDSVGRAIGPGDPEYDARLYEHPDTDLLPGKEENALGDHCEAEVERACETMLTGPNFETHTLMTEFNKVDIDKNGHVTMKQLQTILRRTIFAEQGSVIDDLDVQDFASEFDFDDKGRLSFEKFVQFLQSQPQNSLSDLVG